MAKPFDTWTVFPHGPIEKVTENLWRVAGPLPGAPFPRTMMIARLSDGRLVIHNAIALDESEMKEIEAWGSPAFLIVPSGAHRLDAKIFKDRYPSMRVIGPRGAKRKIEEIVKVDSTEADFGDTNVRYETVAGTADTEGVLVVRSQGGTTLVFNDVLMNMQKLPGFSGFMMGLFGFTGPKPKVSPPARLFVVKDKKALRAEFEKRAATPDLTRIEVSHGNAITSIRPRRSGTRRRRSDEKPVARGGTTRRRCRRRRPPAASRYRAPASRCQAPASRHRAPACSYRASCRRRAQSRCRRARSRPRGQRPKRRPASSRRRGRPRRPA